jgi:hypothetical protein
VSTVVHHVLLALAVVAVGDASLRAASILVSFGLERALVATVLAVAVVVVETLVLGLFGLGASTIALVALAALTWIAGRVWLPSPEHRPSVELGRWWNGLDTPLRVTAAVLAGAAAGWVAWQLRYPSIGFDSSLYHYAQIAGWVDNGRPGSILDLSYDLPYGNYPLTDEVALTWFAGISRSFPPLVLWNPAMLLLLGLASWVTVRNLSVPRGAAMLAVAAVVTLPLCVHQLNEPQTDLPAFAWLACVAALSTGASRTPLLLAPAIVAAGLAVGTKTTPAVLVAASLGIGLYLARRRLRPLVPWLALASAVALAVGGIWYVRNLVQHGSPLWPFAATRWGDPRPRFLELVDTKLVERLSATLDGRLDMYAGQLAGGVVLLAGALLVVLRGAVPGGLTRPLKLGLLTAGGVTVLALLIWSTAPGTGLPTAAGLLFPETWPASTVRYLLPALGAATVALAFAVRVGGVTGAVATIALAASVVWNVVKDTQLGLPYVPSARTIVLGAALGLLALTTGAVASRAVARRGGPRRLAPGVMAVALAVLVGVGLGPAGEGFVARHAEVTGSTALGPGVAAFLAAQPQFERGDMTIAFASRGLQAQLAGDRLSNRLELIPARETCANVRALARRSVLVVSDPAFLRGLLGIAPYGAHRCVAGRRPAYRDEAFRVYLPESP